MTATFGKLENQTLTLQPGLNVIHAPNEWGKSTWCSFLAVMLYGLDTRAKTTKTALADKERYAPWSGAAMAGRMDLNWKGRDITIERWTKGRTPMGEFKAYETETGLPVPESCPYITRVPGSEALLVIWNNSEYDMHWASHYGKRTPLTVAVTYDNARTFSDFFDIETDPNRAFSNPGSIWLSDNELLLNYWTCPYSDAGRMSGVIDLKQAIIRLDRTKLRK
jgi:hypothetical protein